MLRRGLRDLLHVGPEVKPGARDDAAEAKALLAPRGRDDVTHSLHIYIYDIRIMNIEYIIDVYIYYYRCIYTYFLIVYNIYIYSIISLYRVVWYGIVLYLISCIRMTLY